MGGRSKTVAASTLGVGESVWSAGMVLLPASELSISVSKDEAECFFLKRDGVVAVASSSAPTDRE